MRSIVSYSRRLQFPKCHIYYNSLYPSRNLQSYKFNPSDTSIVFRNKSIVELVSDTLLFQLCKYKLLVSVASKLLSFPYFGSPWRLLVKHTLFRKFCAGQSYESFRKVSEKLQKADHIYSIIDISAEDALTDKKAKENYEEKLKILQKCFELQLDNVKFLPLKLTSIIQPILLEKISAHILSMGDVCCHSLDSISSTCLVPDELSDFLISIQRIENICKEACTGRISILIDAEQTPRQPAVRAIATHLSEIFNKISDQEKWKSPKPYIYSTYQTYLRRTEAHLCEDWEKAQRKGYVFAVKLVRGAYLKTEREREQQRLGEGRDMPHSTSLLQPHKQATDDLYDHIVHKILTSLASPPPTLTQSATPPTIPPALLIATHNTHSVTKAVETMETLGLPRDHPHIAFAQLYGMSDHLSSALGIAGYSCSKLLAFGKFDNVLPYLLRRLEENQDAFGAMQTDKQLFTQEIIRRLFRREEGGSF